MGQVKDGAVEWQYPAGGTDRTMSVSEFKATCLDLIDAMHSGVVRRVTLTKRGKPFVSLSTSPGVRPSDRLFGALAGSVVIPAELDLTAPVIDPSTVEALRDEPLG